MSFPREIETGDVIRVALALDFLGDLICLEAVAIAAIAAVRLRGRVKADAIGRGARQIQREMPVETLDAAERIPHEIEVVDVENRLGERLLIGRLDHQAGPGKPAIADVATELAAVDMPGKRSPQDLGQTGDRKQDAHRIAVYEDHTGIGVDRADRRQANT